MIDIDQTSARWSVPLRRVLVAAALAFVAMPCLSVVADHLSRWSSAGFDDLGVGVASTVKSWPAVSVITTAYAGQDFRLSAAQRSLLGAPQWLNTQPIVANDVRGKVILVNFWTYTCINSLRALPYVRGWASRYADRGLVVIGVHTPEFSFEKDIQNVSGAAKSLGVGYPIALDSDYGIWRAFGNEAWPAFYFIGADGSVRDREFGEGGYSQSERLLQKLLTEANGTPINDPITPIVGIGPQAPADQRNEGSPETYVGYAQATNFASPGGFKREASTQYRSPSELALNRWNLTGAWTVGSEFATLNDASGTILYRFHSRDLHLIMGPSADGRPIRFRVTIDGVPPGAARGVDVDADGVGIVQEPRMYQLVRQARPIADRTFEIEFLDAGVRAYDFTFG